MVINTSRKRKNLSQRLYNYLYKHVNIPVYIYIYI